MVLRQLKISLYHAVMLLMVIIASGYLVGAESAWKASEDAIRTMTPSQAKNLERFLGKIPKNSENVRVKDFLNGGKVFQANSPARNIQGSFAQYEKQIDAYGKTVLHTKTTFSPEGNIVDVAQKFPPIEKVYLEKELNNLPYFKL